MRPELARFGTPRAFPCTSFCASASVALAAVVTLHFPRNRRRGAVQLSSNRSDGPVHRQVPHDVVALELGGGQASTAVSDYEACAALNECGNGVPSKTQHLADIDERLSGNP